MTMPLLRSDGLDAIYLTENPEPAPITTRKLSRPVQMNVPLIAAKLRHPAAAEGVVQQRLLDLLERSVQNHAGTLIVGRAGAGKTSLAAAFAASVPGSSWYTLDAGDGDWGTFAKHFRAAVSGERPRRRGREARRPIDEAVSPLELFADLTAALELNGLEWPALIVLDGTHHLFDSEWFAEFFQLLLASVPPPSHVLMLSRSRPPHPVWRLRSKQVLNVIDEKVLAFSAAESEELFIRHGLSRGEASAAYRECFGRPGKLMRILEQKKPLS